MAETLTLYVKRTDGTSYAEFSIRADEPDAEHIIDREALHRLWRPKVLAVEMRRETGRTGGYRRR